MKGWAQNRRRQVKGSQAMAVRASELLPSALLNANGPGLEKLRGVARLGAGEGVLFYSLDEKSKG